MRLKELREVADLQQRVLADYLNIRQNTYSQYQNGQGQILIDALIKLAKNMVNRDTSFITLIYGEEVSEEDANKAYEELRDKFGSRTDISLVKGDQPVYYFILSVE